MFSFQLRSTLFVLLITSSFSYSQDTLSIYFSTGSHQISTKEQQKLNQLPENYDWSSIDSVSFVGMADSVGRLQSNLRLSMRRAKQVEKYAKRFINVEIPTQNYARGEAYHPDKKINRRVDVILYYQSTPNETPKTPVVQEKKCYTVDYDLLHSANWRTVKHRNREKVLIELPENHKLPSYDLYYGTRDYDNKFLYRKVRWKEQRTGRMWWYKKRYVTSLSKTSFETYRLFRLEDLPCNDCNEPFDSIPRLTKSDSCVIYDEFVTKNFQFSYKLFDRSRVKVRVPKEYIDTSTNYYSYYDSKEETVNWQTKNSSRKSHYYFTELEQIDGNIEFIYKEAICAKKNYSECIESGSSVTINKPFCMYTPPLFNNFSLIVEIGNHYQNESHLPYAALGVSRDDFNSRYSLLVGSDINLGLYSSLRYDYHFLYFPIQQLNIFRSWHHPNKTSYFTSALYLGTELKASLNNKKDPLLDQNVHMGFAIINYKTKPVISRIFVQFGYGYDYFQNQNSRFYPILQGGVVFKIIEFM